MPQVWSLRMLWQDGSGVWVDWLLRAPRLPLSSLCGMSAWRTSCPPGLPTPSTVQGGSIYWSNYKNMHIQTDTMWVHGVDRISWYHSSLNALCSLRIEYIIICGYVGTCVCAMIYMFLPYIYSYFFYIIPRHILPVCVWHCSSTQCLRSMLSLLLAQCHWWPF